MTIRRLLFALVCALVAALPATADELRPGYLEWTQRDATRWTVVWKAPVLGGLATRATPLLPRSCHQERSAARLDDGAVVTEMEVTCTRTLAGAEVGLSAMADTFTDALVRIAPMGQPVQAARLTPRSPRVTVATVPSTASVARSYFALGVQHIVLGWDHLLFVIALVLLLGTLRPVVAAATAFTVAHSLTLAGTTVGLFGLPQAPVEALIALSIVFLAVEIAKAEPARPGLSQRVPWLVAFLFGLLHGFGFAGALREIGLPETDVPMALLTFNLGVEAGQLFIVGAVLAVLAALRRWALPALRPATLAATYGIGTVASFWFIERLSG